MRELFEETGLTVSETALRPLGVHAYRRGKDLALFCWPSPQMPDPRSLVCTSCFPLGGRMIPEFDRFGLFSHEEAVQRVGKDMARLLAEIPLDSLCGASD